MSSLVKARHTVVEDIPRVNELLKELLQKPIDASLLL
jgi:hypothetical protein